MKTKKMPKVLSKNLKQLDFSMLESEITNRIVNIQDVLELYNILSTDLRASGVNMATLFPIYREIIFTVKLNGELFKILETIKQMFKDEFTATRKVYSMDVRNQDKIMKFLKLIEFVQDYDSKALLIRDENLKDLSNVIGLVCSEIKEKENDKLKDFYVSLSRFFNVDNQEDFEAKMEEAIRANEANINGYRSLSEAIDKQFRA